MLAQRRKSRDFRTSALWSAGRARLAAMAIGALAGCASDDVAGPGSEPDAAQPARDASKSVGREASATSDKCEGWPAVWEFERTHRNCTNDACVTLGSCTFDPVFHAVASKAAAELQRLIDQTPRECRGYDGPILRAECVDGMCVLQPTGRACGEPLLDAGLDGAIDGSTIYDGSTLASDASDASHD
jgi:hypothetical protein